MWEKIYDGMGYTHYQEIWRKGDIAISCLHTNSDELTITPCLITSVTDKRGIPHKKANIGLIEIVTGEIANDLEIRKYELQKYLEKANTITTGKVNNAKEIRKYWEQELIRKSTPKSGDLNAESIVSSFSGSSLKKYLENEYYIEYATRKVRTATLGGSGFNKELHLEEMLFITNDKDYIKLSANYHKNKSYTPEEVSLSEEDWKFEIQKERNTIPLDNTKSNVSKNPISKQTRRFQFEMQELLNIHLPKQVTVEVMLYKKESNEFEMGLLKSWRHNKLGTTEITFNTTLKLNSNTVSNSELITLLKNNKNKDSLYFNGIHDDDELNDIAAETGTFNVPEIKMLESYGGMSDKDKNKFQRFIHKGKTTRHLTLSASQDKNQKHAIVEFKCNHPRVTVEEFRYFLLDVFKTNECPKKTELMNAIRNKETIKGLVRNGIMLKKTAEKYEYDCEIKSLIEGLKSPNSSPTTEINDFSL